MVHAGPTESFEIERKYAVAADATLPSTAAFTALGLTLSAAEEHRLEARYFDTPEFALGAQRVAVRLRRGGTDEGWHLKERGEAGVRELMWPPSDTMPTGLTAEIEGRIGSAAEHLTVIGSLSTRRIVTYVLRDATPIVEIADDHVTANNELTGQPQAWREWEAELLAGAEPHVLEHIEPLFTAAGAKRVLGTSKIQRTMRGVE